MTFETAVAAVRTAQLARVAEDEAITILLREAIRYRKALEFYAETANYLDSAPMLASPEDNLLTFADDGFTARRALRKDDYVIIGPVVRGKEEGNSNAQA